MLLSYFIAGVPIPCTMVKSGLSSTNFIMFLKSLLCISSSLVVAYLFYVCLSNSDFNKNEGSEAQRLKKLTQSSFEMCAVIFSFIKVVTLPLNDLFLFCWSTLGATESKDLFCECDDAFDLVLG